MRREQIWFVIGLFLILLHCVAAYGDTRNLQEAFSVFISVFGVFICGANSAKSKD